MFSLKRILPSAVLSVICLAANANATTFAELSLDDLVTHSPVIARGHVGKVESFWNADRTAIYSHVTFQVEEMLRGNVKEKQIVILLPGGTVEDVSQVIIGAPRMESEKELILMLQKLSTNQAARTSVPSGYNLVGLSQGCSLKEAGKLRHGRCQM